MHNKTTQEDLAKMSPSECYVSYQEAAKNALSFVEDAEDFASKAKYGRAIACLILGSEEYVKAVIFYFQGIGLHFHKAKKVNKFFTSHTTRHDFAKFFGMFANPTQLMASLVNKIKHNLHHPNEPIVLTSDEEALWNHDEEKVREMFSNFAELLEWWEAADDIKQNGLYVTAKLRGVQSPAQISEEQFLIAKGLTMQFIGNFQYIIGMAELIPTNEVKKAAKQFNDKHAYQFLEIFTDN